MHKNLGKAAKTFTEKLKRIKGILDRLNYTWILRYRQISLRGELQPFAIATYSE
ncbi:MAG: hypothetical protein GX799_05970 [Crenarchaeota archaeon]|nr:hypothetical protein [Thermoproteota archaeon]